MLSPKEILFFVQDKYDGLAFSSKSDETFFEIKLSDGRIISDKDFTKSEISAIKQRSNELENEAEAEAEAKRSAALAKLEALGLDEDDLKALGL